jgi:hypothetical protein
VRKRVDVDHLLEPRFADEAVKRLNLEDYWHKTADQTALGHAGGPRS